MTAHNSHTRGWEVTQPPCFGHTWGGEKSHKDWGWMVELVERDVFDV